MGGWIPTYEDNEKEVWECAICNDENHTIIVDKVTRKQTYGKPNFAC